MQTTIIFLVILMIGAIGLLTWAFFVETHRAQRNRAKPPVKQVPRATELLKRGQAKALEQPPLPRLPRGKPESSALRAFSTMLSFVTSASLGIGLSSVIFFAPAWISGNDNILLWWGWFGMPLGGGVGLGAFILGMKYFPDSFYEGFGGRFV